MTRIVKRIVTLAASVLALALASCINVEQDIWINEDGSGRVKMDMGVSKQMMEMVKGLGEGAEGADPFDTAEQKKKLEANPNVKSVKVETKEGEKFTHFIYDIELKDITKLDEVQDGLFEDGPVGGGGEGPESDLKIVKLDNGNYHISAKLEGDTPPAGEGGPDEAALAMMKQMFGDSAFTIRVHGPPVKHNGKLEGDAASWSLPLVDLATGETLEVDAEVKP